MIRTRTTHLERVGIAPIWIGSTQYFSHIKSFWGQKIMSISPIHDDVIKWKHFPRYWPFVRGIHRSPVNSPHKGLWRGALMFILICARIKGWVNNREAGDLRRFRAHYDVIVMIGWRVTNESQSTVNRRVRVWAISKCLSYIRNTHTYVFVQIATFKTTHVTINYNRITHCLYNCC